MPARADTTVCDACNKTILSDIAIMDPDNREILCPECCKKEYPAHYRYMMYTGIIKKCDDILDSIAEHRKRTLPAMQPPAPCPQYERGDLP
jgi:hypothetical protein